MSFGKLFDVAASGMMAQSVRMNTTASNMANADNVASSADNVYKARKPVFQQIELSDPFAMNDDSIVAVEILGVVEKQGEIQREYAPYHHKADADGYIYKSNVNMLEEMSDMMQASRSYQNNVEIMLTAREMALRTLTIGQ